MILPLSFVIKIINCGCDYIAPFRRASSDTFLDDNIDSDENYRWLKMLISPGSSLGGARLKACVTDEQGHLWIAKFPNLNDTHVSLMQDFEYGWSFKCIYIVDSTLVRAKVSSL